MITERAVSCPRETRQNPFCKNKANGRLLNDFRGLTAAVTSLDQLDRAVPAG